MHFLKIFSILIFTLSGEIRDTVAQDASSMLLGSASTFDLAQYVYYKYKDPLKPVFDQFMDDVGMTRIDENTVEVTAGGETFNITGPAECDICAGLAKTIKLGDYEQLFNASLRLCIQVLGALKLNSEYLCTGLLELQSPHISKVLKDDRVTAERFCEYINSCFPAQKRRNSRGGRGGGKTRSCPCDDQAVIKVERRKRNAIKIIQLTDIHVEPEYAEGSSTDCGLPVCCLEKWGKGNASSLGDYQCNIPRKTMQMFFEATAAFKPDYIIYTGDSPPHRMWDETEESQISCTELLVEMLQRTLPNYNVYPVIGNHELFPTNLFSWSHLNYTESFIEKWRSLWKPLTNFREGVMQDSGSYSIRLRPGLRLIVFNTNYMYTLNFYNSLNDLSRAEVDKMKKFVENSLSDAKENNEKVVLVGHHPPGNSDYTVTGSRWMEQLIDIFADIIVVMFTGHTHIDEFRMVYNRQGLPRGIVYTAPSMTTAGRKNPSMRVYYLDRVTHGLIDYAHYYLDLSAAIAAAYEGQTTNWKKISLLYSARKEYGLCDLSPQSWDDLLKRFVTDKELLMTHLRHANADAGPNHTCDDNCAALHIITMKNINYDEYKEDLTKLQNP